MFKKIIGTGAYGQIFSCNGTAIKVVPNDKDIGVSLIELYIMKNIDHKFLTKASSITCCPKKTQIHQEQAMFDLRQYYKKNNITDENYNNWKNQILSGINCLHQHGIIHGDIKCSNVLLFKDNTVKLTDFSLSMFKEYIDVKITDWSHSTIDDVICTPSHRPPEIWLQRNWNNRVDIWSFGCTLFELKNKTYLFPGDTEKEIYNYFYNKKEYLLHRELENAYFDDLINKCLLLDPESRPSCEDLTSEKIPVYYCNPNETLRNALIEYIKNDDLYFQDLFLKIYEQLPKKNPILCRLITNKLLQLPMSKQKPSILKMERNFVNSGLNLKL